MWIREYRERCGLDLDEFGAMVRRRGARKRKPVNCSNGLIALLESDPNAVTHPHIADLLAEACGATRSQRDMIVAECHRSGGRAAAARMGSPWRTEAAVTAHKRRKMRPGRAIVKIDREGRILARYISYYHAASEAKISKWFIYSRCNGLLRREFTDVLTASYRFADEWEQLTPEQRQERMRKAGGF